MSDSEEPVELPVREYKRRRVHWGRVALVLALWAVVAAGIIWQVLT